MQEKRILVFLWKDIKHPYAGGGVTYAFRIAKEWQKKGHKVLFLTPNFKGSKKKETINGVNVIRVGSKYTSYLLFPLYYLINLRNKVTHIIDIENGIPYFTPFFSRKPKVMLTYHLQKKVFFKELPWFIAWFPYILELYIMPLAYFKTKIMTISDGSKNDLKEIGFKEKNIHIGYCGFDIPKIKKPTKFKNPTVVYIGRIEQYKRVDLLIKLFEKANVPKSQLIIAGNGRQLNAIKKLVSSSKLKSRVKVLGPISEEDKYQLYGEAWVNATTSEKEGWGMTMIEGNAMNTPALGFNIPGLSESITNGISGYLANNEEEFVNILTELLKGKRKLNGLVEYSKKFSWETTANLALDLLDNHN